jgi:C4-dicarboxylate transporter DctM subunit
MALALGVVLMAFGVPIAVVLGTAGTLALYTSGINLLVVPQQFFSNVSNYSLLAIPFFMLTGAVMEATGVSRRLIDFSQSLVGFLRGAMGHVTILASMFFADISGSATADTAAIGSILIPGMVKMGYARPFATALQSAAGSLGLLFPPSMSMLIYAYTANVSVGKMFMASLIPGLLVVVSFMFTNYIIARRRDYGAVEEFSARRVLVAFREAIWALLAPVVILGGIFGGVFTPVEAGVVATLYVTFVGVFIYRALHWHQLKEILFKTLVNTTRVSFLLGVAFVVGRYLIEQQIPATVAHTFLTFTASALIFLLFANLFFMVVHSVLETISSIIVVIPVFLPLAVQLGIDPVAFGIIVLINSAIGINLPPVGFCLFTACSISGVSIEAATRAIVPFLGALLVDLAIVSAFPQVSLFLPRFLGW